MDLKQLSYFITVVEEGNISLAAKKLHMSQPPLSTQMKLLEEELECTLFERGSRKIVLTEAGRILYHKALSMMSMAKQTKKQIKDYNDGTTGVLRIGVISSVSSTIFADYIKGFHDQYPGVTYEITEANTYELLEQIQTDLLEFAIIRTPFHGHNLHCEYLNLESMLAIGKQEAFSFTDGDTMNLQELASYPLIYYRRWESILEETFQNNNLNPTVLCVNDDARTTAYLAQTGLGVGIIPESAFPLIQTEGCVAKKISDDALLSRIAVVYHDNTYLSTIAKNFITFIVSLYDH
ncbi:transcriptional regulator, LysR family [Lachnospiraceae bacterium KM106-2]|nr:transcriptional regulator, LysR family [Lachnospiraceae bacterium KM106-2]